MLIYHRPFAFFQVGEAQLVSLLEKLSQHTQKKTTIKVKNNCYYFVTVTLLY